LLIDFSIKVVNLIKSLPEDRITNYLSGQTPISYLEEKTKIKQKIANLKSQLTILKSQRENDSIDLDSPFVQNIQKTCL
jgi:hypothetical protein